MHKNLKAFTLVELAIVIVIIGLLVGGVLQGQELIKQAQIRNLVSNVNGLNAAHVGFYGKYNGIAGDYVRANMHFPNCITRDSLPTCNGDGNSTISGPEGLTFFRLLSLAGFIKGEYRGNYNSNILALNENLPSSKFKNVGYFAVAHRPYNLAGNYLHVALFSAQGSLTTSNVGFSFLTPMDAFEIDNKFDDGVPNTGNWIAARGNGSSLGTCASFEPWDGNAPTSNVTYMTSNNVDCMLVVKMQM